MCLIVSLYSTVICEVCNKKIHRILGKRNAYVCRGLCNNDPTIVGSCSVVKYFLLIDCKICTHKSCHGNVKDPCPNSSYHHMTM